MYQGNDKDTQIKSIASAFFVAEFEYVLVWWDIIRISQSQEILKITL